MPRFRVTFEVTSERTEEVEIHEADPTDGDVRAALREMLPFEDVGNVSDYYRVGEEAAR